MNTSSRSILSKLFKHISPKLRRQFVLLCFLNIGMVLVEMGVAGAVSLLGVAMASPQSLKKVPYFDCILSLLPQSDVIHPGLMPLLFVMFCVAVATCLKNCMTAFLTYNQTFFSQSVSWDIGRTLFHRFLYAPHIWHLGQNSAVLLTVLGWKSTVSQYFVNVQTLITQILIAVSLLFCAIVANPVASLVLFGVICSVAAFVYRYAKGRAYDCGNELRRYDIFNSRVAMQGLQGLREIAIADKQPAFEQAFARYIPKYVPAASWQSLYPPLPQWILESTGMLLLSLVLLYLALGGAGPARAAGVLSLFAAISWRLLPAANKGLAALLSMRTQQPILEQLLDRLENTPLGVETRERAVLNFRDAICLNHVSFRYPGTAKPALNDVSMTIKRGSMVGLVGLSGSGKSTLSGILTGGLDPESGKILVDGKPLDNRKSRLSLGFVPQSLYLLDAPLSENVAFCVDGESVDEERVRKCCEMAAMDFISDLPEGIHTVLGERGVRLSGGQIQRVGIARALYGNPELLIFDEATSALDGATEQTIQNTIDGLKQSVTMLIIAHRLATVRNCDYVYWLDGGKYKKSGKPEDVLKEYEEYLSESRIQ